MKDKASLFQICIHFNFSKKKVLPFEELLSGIPKILKPTMKRKLRNKFRRQPGLRLLRYFVRA
jgi:hypothetical protein